MPCGSAVTVSLSMRSAPDLVLLERGAQEEQGLAQRVPRVLLASVSPERFAIFLLAVEPRPV